MSSEPPAPGTRVDAPLAQGVVVGDNATVHNTWLVSGASAAVVWPVWVGSVPGLADCWQPRADEQAALGGAGGASVVVLTQVLSGMGGVGKTQLAVAHAQQLWADRQVDLLVWTTAGSRGCGRVRVRRGGRQARCGGGCGWGACGAAVPGVFASDR